MARRRSSKGDSAGRTTPARRGRPPRLAHLVAGSPASQRRARSTLAEGAASAPAEPGPSVSDPDILCLPNPEWLPHRLTVSGPAGDIAGFRPAASGPGQIAWASDYERYRDDWTSRLLGLCAGRPDLSAEHARALAREVSAVVEMLDLAAADQIAMARCPLDLNALVPLPESLRRLGPEDPVVVAWQWRHWGTTWMLRGVEEEPVDRAEIRIPSEHAAVRFRFWAADWTPWRALDAVRRRWPALTLALRLLTVAE
ncbi:hypothetical protein [Acidiphilium iwatense]|uniref:Uncharacterized protein n=1 Tax=Acidiphilium iwatense TaxID=768198 RepID=A0ABS9DSR5_9PROT|nr:hypothetical protein [Acidiphilium iwatense]MCF3945786.1 hypothetical protein [Acidiphilium iwatense]